jgi:hypothetical protein
MSDFLFDLTGLIVIVLNVAFFFTIYRDGYRRIEQSGYPDWARSFWKLILFLLPGWGLILVFLCIPSAHARTRIE